MVAVLSYLACIGLWIGGTVHEGGAVHVIDTMRVNP